jgi:hypothetical protein
MGINLKDDRCWKDLGEPYHDPDFTRDPDASVSGKRPVDRFELRLLRYKGELLWWALVGVGVLDSVLGEELGTVL